jgi:hypothetical protein
MELDSKKIDFDLIFLIFKKLFINKKILYETLNLFTKHHTN